MQHRDSPRIVTGVCVYLIVTGLFSAVDASAETITFPEEELAKESVLPVFDKTVVVRERAIKTEKRFEAGGGIGLNLIEPLYSTLSFNLSGTYHFDEVHGVNIQGIMLSGDLSNSAKDLKAGKGLNNNPFDASLAPHIESIFLAHYQFAAYYGKFSVTKQTTMHISLYGLFGGGLINWEDTSELGLDAGVGQKIYFTKNLALRTDLLLAIYQGPDPTDLKGDNDNTLNDGVKRKSSDFEKTVYFRPFLILTMNYLF